MDCFVKALLRDPLLQESLLYESGLTMLHVACACSNMDLIEDLCDQGLDVNARAYQTSPIFPGCTPLHVLIIKFKNNISHISEMIYMLINHGTDVTIASAEQKTPVHELFDCFVAQGYELVSLLLRNQKDYSKNPVTVQGISHFHIACLYKEETVVAEFLKHGVDIHLPIDYFCEIYGGLTPLHLASMQHFKDIAFFLRKREIDVRSVTSFILSTRHESWHSTIHAYKETVNLLLRHGADLNIKDKFDNTPLHVAAMSNLPQKDVFHSLIRAGAPTESENVMGETPIQVLLSSTGPNILVSVFFTVTKNNANKAHL
ncbi:serine/threonine-protein phosphatase 6 regulatory ankyrin repeat subunit C-like [Phymastichus coffea]|uniref:serine/threonine-protein phosphatase 6 regulatory ankyrin repeat subunit C-like n=1 Tax=Phymastichus coffea TaxID=108790 RepID=UPI00273B4624|nr:serine/threonine-protein phosphatase 6 regulatory ankyrin repeat subunit C-like [Phymastichus coffea]